MSILLKLPAGPRLITIPCQGCSVSALYGNWCAYIDARYNSHVSFLWLQQVDKLLLFFI